MPTIRLTTLGALRVQSDGVELSVGELQPKRLALLTYLVAAQPRGSHRRDTILALLWPELDHDRARSALRQALHALRKALGPDAIATSGNESVSLDRAAMSCDLWDLDDATSAGNHARVAELYQGDLAQGLFVTAAAAFHDWLDGERARVRAVVRDSAWCAMDTAASERRPADCIANARRALSLSELDESAVRRAMRRVAEVGEHATALTFYDSFAATLRCELDTDPSAATSAVADEIRRARATRLPVAGVAPVRHDASSAIAAAVVERPKARRGHVGAAAAAAVLAVVLGARLAPSATSALDQTRVRVEPFVNASTTTSLDTLARSTTLATHDALVRLDNVRLVSDAAAEDRDAGTIVRGAIRVSGDSLELRADVVDRRTGVVARNVVSRMPLSADASQRTHAMDAFGDRVSAAVATALYPGWGTALSQPPSFAGYRAFVDGMRSIKRERHDLAVAAFRGAYAADSSFTAAGLLAAMEHYQMRQFASADSITTVIEARRATLPAVDGLLLTWLRTSLGGDRLAARIAMAGVVAIAPTADLAWLQLAIDDVETARPHEALAALEHIDPEGEFGEGWVAYWATKVEALHMTRDHTRELAIAREGLRLHPEFRVLASYELRALASLGRASEIERALPGLLALPTAAGFDPRTALRQTALELAVHGNEAASRRVLAAVLAWYAARPAVERSEVAYESALARTAYLADDRREARRLYSALLSAHPKCLDCTGALAVLDARDGNRAGAVAGMATLAAISRPFLFGRPLQWQARIAAALGDRSRASSLALAAFASGAELDVMTHADPDLRAIQPDSIYRSFARVER
ncbi:MAG TPA: BTAD domain-containing putative transcriptional regulator [Gemmatimonadaceae bacterium]|nr:BTAD domain-containing putative transcriptional regulator [Gemmatimonadaceae bacterium]